MAKQQAQTAAWVAEKERWRLAHPAYPAMLRRVEHKARVLARHGPLEGLAILMGATPWEEVTLPARALAVARLIFVSGRFTHVSTCVVEEDGAAVSLLQMYLRDVESEVEDADNNAMHAVEDFWQRQTAQKQRNLVFSTIHGMEARAGCGIAHHLEQLEPRDQDATGPTETVLMWRTARGSGHARMNPHDRNKALEAAYFLGAWYFSPPRAACPACGSDHVEPIIYGLVMHPKKHAVLGGCAVFDGMDTWACMTCRTRW